MSMEQEKMNQQASQQAPNEEQQRLRQEQTGESDKNENKVYAYNAEWEIYSIAFSSREDYPVRLGIGSFIEEEMNKI